MSRTRHSLAAVLTSAALVAGGLVGAGAAVATAVPAAAASLPKCPVNALKGATKPVEITFWHGLNRANEETLQKLTDQFNASQSDVKVKLVNQVGYDETFEKIVAGLSSGDLPDIVQLEDTRTQAAIDTQAFVPASSCIKADEYPVKDYVPRVLTRYTVQGTLWPMPFNVSNPVLIYDKAAFRLAGLDPDKPPTNLTELSAAAKAIKDTGQYEAGYGLKLDPWYLEQWMAKGDKLYVNQRNGRAARATKVLFDGPDGRAVFSWMSQMVKSGLAITNSAEGGSAYDNLLGIRSKKDGMTIDSSATLGTITQVLSSGEGANVELGVGPMPGPSGGGGVLVGGGALYMVRKSSPAKQAAAWKYEKFLDSPQSQAVFAAGTGYVPIRKSSVQLPEVQDLWTKTPGYKVAYDQLLTGKNDVATQGPVIGAYYDVRQAVLAGEQQMFTQGTPPKQALKNAATKANAAMKDYNTRVGG